MPNQTEQLTRDQESLGPRPDGYWTEEHCPLCQSPECEPIAIAILPDGPSGEEGPTILHSPSCGGALAYWPHNESYQRLEAADESYGTTVPLWQNSSFLPNKFDPKGVEWAATFLLCSLGELGDSELVSDRVLSLARELQNRARAVYNGSVKVVDSLRD